MKTEVIIGGNGLLYYYDPKKDRIIQGWWGCFDDADRYINVETIKELTGRWKTTTNKIRSTTKLEIEVEYTHTWETTKKKYVKVIEYPEVYYTRWLYFFQIRHYTQGKVEIIPKETIVHTRTQKHWLSELYFDFSITMEDSDYEVTINECAGES